MSSAAAAPSPLGMAAEGRAAQLGVELLTGLGAAETTWRELEAEGTASPYQRFDWVKAFVEKVMPGADIRIAVARDGAGTPVVLFPFLIERRAGIRVATALGGKHANFNLMIGKAGWDLSIPPGGVLGILRELSRRAGVDVIAIPYVPQNWDARPNPLAALGTASPSNGYEVLLEPDPDATARRSMSNEARKRLRNKERGLAKLGEVAFAQALDEQSAERLLDAFFRQKEERFRDLGIPDPFRDPGIRNFIRTASLEGLSEGRPAIELYGLTVGERVAAVLGGAADASRLSGMFISFEACREATKFSPGDILVSRVVREQCLRGRRYFDLGVGEARYKSTFCNDTVELVDIFLPVSSRGQVYALGLRGLAGLKRRIKQSPAAMRLVSRLRRLKPA